MASFNVHLHAHVEQDKNISTWSLILTNENGKELSHYLGAAETVEEDTAYHAAIDGARELMKKSPNHKYTLYIPTNKYDGYARISGLMPAESPAGETTDLAKVMAESAWKFVLVGGLKRNGYQKAKVTNGSNG